MLFIYNDTSNFAKLHRVLISIDDNLNFIINFMSARWNFLKVSKKVLCVTCFCKNFQNHSIGFKSGEYGGRNKSSSFSLLASRNGSNSFEWCARALSKIKRIFPASLYLARSPSKKCWNYWAFRVSENATCTFPSKGSTAPIRCCRFRPPYVETTGCCPFNDHMRVMDGENWILNSSWKRITPFSPRESRLF